MPLPSTMVVSSLVMMTFFAWPSIVEVDVLQLEAEVLGDELCRR